MTRACAGQVMGLRFEETRILELGRWDLVFVQPLEIGSTSISSAMAELLLEQLDPVISIMGAGLFGAGGARSCLLAPGNIRSSPGVTRSSLGVARVVFQNTTRSSVGWRAGRSESLDGLGSDTELHRAALANCSP